MYSKNRVLSLINKKAPEYIEALGLTNLTIIFRVIDHKDVRLKERCKKHCRGLSFINNKEAIIYLIHDNIVDHRDAASTLLHELFHVLLYSLTKRLNRSGKIEEKIVLGLENLWLQTNLKRRSHD